jgi:hypothetical protein
MFTCTLHLFVANDRLLLKKIFLIFLAMTLSEGFVKKEISVKTTNKTVLKMN